MVCFVLFVEFYLYVDWGLDFCSQYDVVLLDWVKVVLVCNFGLLVLQYIMQNGGSGYFCIWVVSSYLDGGIL